MRLDSIDEVQGWLFTIARRQLSHYLRRGQVERRALNRLGLSVPEMADDDIAEIERALDLDGLRATLSVELKRLSSEQRDALQLRVVEELPYDQVAERLGTTQSNARARVSRGLRALAAALDPVPLEERSNP